MTIQTFKSGDTNFDGSVDVRDVLHIVSNIVNLEDSPRVVKSEDVLNLETLPKVTHIGSDDKNVVFLGNITVNGDITTLSDGRYKENINNTFLGLDFINELRPVSYQMKNSIDKRYHEGLIAQEVDFLLSRIEGYKNSIVCYDERTDKYSLNYIELITPLLKSIQELSIKVVNLENQVKALQNLTTTKQPAVL